MKTMASFETSGAIKVNGADTGMKWEPNRWYKVAAMIDLKTARWSVYINGVNVADNEPVGGLNSIDFLRRFKVWINMPSAAGDYDFCAAFDDLKMYNSAYNPAADQLGIASKSDYIVSDTDKKIYISSAAAQDAFANGLSLTNAQLAGIYSDAALTTAVSGNVEAGNYTVFKSVSGNVYDVYQVSYMDTVLGIESADYLFSNTEEYICAPLGTPANVFYSKIRLYGGHTGQLIIGETPLRMMLS